MADDDDKGDALPRDLAGLRAADAKVADAVRARCGRCVVAVGEDISPGFRTVYVMPEGAAKFFPCVLRMGCCGGGLVEEVFFPMRFFEVMEGLNRAAQVREGGRDEYGRGG